MPNRRQFLGASLAAAVALGLPGTTVAQAARPLKILVMGGTGFLGPHFVAAARARGHVLTLFNRGKTNPGLFKDIEQLHGDRKLDLSALEGREWDAVLDTSAYLPADVTRSATLLAKAVQQYLIVSTVSVYADTDKPDADEDAKLIVLPDPTVQQVTAETYGGLKALSEQAAQAAMPGKVTVVRPGLIVGPGDNSDRFTYWPARVARGGEVLAPDSPDAPTQFIDARDLSAFMLRLIETRSIGVFNADAKPGALTMGALLASCERAAANDAKVTWVSADFLEAQKVSAWADMPCWIPATGENAGFGRTSVARAEKAGLTWRPLDETVRDTLAWWRGLPEERRAKPKAGIPSERESQVLAAWHARHKTNARRMSRAFVLCLALLASSLAWAASPAAPTEPQRIEALIAAVGQLKGATFIRNGSAHTAAEAADHLRLKWKNAGKRVRTAEDFIRYCATQSSMSGRKYRIRLADGREVDSADWFNAELRRYDAAHAAKTTPPPAPKPKPASSPG